MKTTKRIYGVTLAILMSISSAIAQSDHIADGLASVATIASETKTVEDSIATDTVTATPAVKEIPLWKQKLYYGYNFDIYFHHDSRSNRKENGWSIALNPELGWKLTDRIYLGMRFGGSYANSVTTYDVSLPIISHDGSLKDTTYSTDLRIQSGSWEVAPYVRYRMKTLFNGKVGIWLEAHLYTGMEFPRVTDGTVRGTDYDGLKHSVTYGAQLSPVITYRFNRKSTFQIFFSILSLGYSGTTFCYINPETGKRYNEYTNDVIIFSGKLRNMIANQFTPGLYGLRFGVQKNF
ncbi:MAG: hypothetical protein J6T32_00210 [Paludibacteraceae bacterium]|nr:hypothetical protein [Paludibacteraceae bacterium]